MNLARCLATVAVVGAIGGAMGGCATVTRGSRQTWSVETDPSGARVETSLGQSCEQTPCTFRMKRKHAFAVTITKDGYRRYYGYVEHQVSAGGAAGMAGNVILGGIVGAGIDLATGAMNELRPNPLKVKLEPAAPPAPNGGFELRN